MYNYLAWNPQDILSKMNGNWKFLDMVVVSVNGGSLYIKKIVSKNKNIIDKIIPGDIFYTKKKK